MPNRQSNQDQQQKGRNPNIEAPDDDESLDDPVRADQQPIQGANRQAQDDRRRRPEENVEQVEQEEAEDDEDESDGISQRP